MRKLAFLLASLFLLGIGMANAQTRTISGKVVSGDDGEPIIGATIMIKGTTQGTISSANGSFSLTLPSSSRALSVSYVGMKTT